MLGVLSLCGENIGGARQWRRVGGYVMALTGFFLNYTGNFLTDYWRRRSELGICCESHQLVRRLITTPEYPTNGFTAIPLLPSQRTSVAGTTWTWYIQLSPCQYLSTYKSLLSSWKCEWSLHISRIYAVFIVFRGNAGLTYEEAKTHFTAWALMKSPLLIGTNARTLLFSYVRATDIWLAFCHHTRGFGHPHEPRDSCDKSR